VRYVIEGTWSGYTSAQSRVVYREVTKDKKFADAVAQMGSIHYTDGTALYLQIRPAALREKVTEIKSYAKLIRDCVRYNVASVEALYKKKNASRP